MKGVKDRIRKSSEVCEEAAELMQERNDNSSGAGDKW